MSKWSKALKGKEEKQKCPRCWKKSIVKTIYKAPGTKVSYRAEGVLDKYSLNCIVEYKCESCGFTTN